MIDPLLPHLLDIVSDPASDSLILAGGFGIRLKQMYLRESGSRTLMDVFPEARATQDLDFFLSLSLFVQRERGAAVRALLDRLGYTDYTPKFQFGKSVDADTSDFRVKVDLLARTPEGEAVQVKKPRVGINSGVNLHGYETPEAFAIEGSAQPLPIRGQRSDGTEVTATVSVPHPYTWLNLKVKAAHDCLRMEREEISRKPNSEKHVFDVYLLIAMLTETELAEASQLAAHYYEHSVAAEVRRCALELYGTAVSPGVDEIRRQTREQIDYPLFWSALSAALGISA